MGDEIEIGVRPAGTVGTKSFELEYEVRSGAAVAARPRPSSSPSTTRRGARSMSRNHGGRRSPPDGRLRTTDAAEQAAPADGADGSRAVGVLLHHARGRLAVRDAGHERNRPFAEHMFFKGTESRPPRATSATRSTASAASSTPSPARSTRATTSAAPASIARSLSTSSSTCSGTRRSIRRRSTARRA